MKRNLKKYSLCTMILLLITILIASTYIDTKLEKKPSINNQLAIVDIESPEFQAATNEALEKNLELIIKKNLKRIAKLLI